MTSPPGENKFARRMLFLGRAIFISALAGIAIGISAQEQGREERGARVVAEFQARLRATADNSERDRLNRCIAEVRAALENNSRPPVPRRIDVLEMPFVHYRYAFAKVGGGAVPANNVPSRGMADPSTLDPSPSTFWSRPTNLRAQDLRAGFGRRSVARYEDRIWTYVAPKKSYGAHAGFEVESGGERLKVKFGEVHSEPFTARIFHALGYNVEVTDYAPGLKVRYDPRVFTEFNSRKPLDTRLTAAGVLPVWTIHFQPRHDAFRFIAGAVMKDGRRVTAKELKAMLPHDEARIEYIITNPANVQPHDATARNIGPWDFGQLGHENLRELRGAGLLAAWLGWFDSRFDNTRLKVVATPSGPQLKHYFSDLGGGLRQRNGWLGRVSDGAEGFASVFTEPEIRQGKGRMTIPFRIVNFRPIERTPAFEEMTVDDARWMARWIAQLTEEQVLAALEASGFDSREANQFADKLLARRARMLRDLGLVAD